MVDMINLPTPRPLLPSLLEAGFSREIATAASKLYTQRAEEFKRRTEMTLVVAWQKMATLSGVSVSTLDPLTQKDISTFTGVYLRYLEEWKEEMVQLLKRASKVSTKVATQRSSRSFNHEYVPLLEGFFEENPFPTHADKLFLAKKSDMQYRQIHVWFQNRRNRTKKGAKLWMRKPILEGTTKPLEILDEHAKCYVVRPVPHTLRPSEVSLSEADEIRANRNVPRCVFISPPPPHAFPSSYPPMCAYNPFPCKCGPISFEKPEWRRTPCSKLSPSVPIGLDDLVEKFALLNVRGERLKGFRGPQSHAATAAITVKQTRAPHPSLIIQKHSDFMRVPVYPSDRTCPTFTRFPMSQPNLKTHYDGAPLGVTSRQRSSHQTQDHPVTAKISWQKSQP